MALDDEKFKILLLEKQKQFEKISAMAATARKPVVLDPQSVGRLSRQDALQQQAMAKAQEQLRQQEQKRIRNALARMAAGEFGYCLECGDEIVPARLDVDPMSELCIQCKK